MSIQKPQERIRWSFREFPENKCMQYKVQSMTESSINNLLGSLSTRYFAESQKEKMALSKVGCTSSFSGYVAKLCDIKNTDRFNCPLCRCLLREPIQTERGEIACSGCYNRAYDKETGICPIDKEPSDGRIHRDRAKEKDILALICCCGFEKDGCKWRGEIRGIEEHERDCAYRSEKCQFCPKTVNASKMISHQYECPGMISRYCPVSGCTYKPVDALDLNNHLQEYMILHAHLQRKIYDEQQSMITILEMEKEDRDNEIKVLKKQQQQQEKKIVKLESQVSELLQEKESESKKTTAEKPDLTKLSTDVSLMNKQLSDLDLRQQLFENTTFDGKLIWKIDNVAARIQQAKSGRVTALHSAPAFTQRHGYKFCARLYLNGDGLGRNTHVSLFFVLMKSEYDSRLSWPFNRTVKFKLINQENQGLDITESFNPDQQSTSFRRPVRDMNIASGCPRFISIDSFANGGYVKDDCIFLEIETTEMDLTPA